MAWLPIFFKYQSSGSNYTFTSPDKRAERLVIAPQMDAIISQLTDGESPFEFASDTMSRQDRARMLAEIDSLIEVLS